MFSCLISNFLCLSVDLFVPYIALLFVFHFCVHTTRYVHFVLNFIHISYTYCLLCTFIHSLFLRSVSVCVSISFVLCNLFFLVSFFFLSNLNESLDRRLIAQIKFGHSSITLHDVNLSG